jgi:hypothetical protein
MMTPGTRRRVFHTCCVAFRAGITLLAAILAVNGLCAAAQQAGGVQATGPKIRMLRSVAGTKGAQKGGSYTIEDPRTVFYAPGDREVIVYFEWEGPKGTHHCEGMVRGPNSQLAVMSSFDYPATQTRFGGYWKVPLSDSAAPGAWTFQARVDGESAGELTFEIVAGERPADAVKQPALPTTAEIYRHAVAASVFIEKLDGKGQPFASGSGFFLDDGMLLTAFRAVDGAHALRILLPDGRRTQTDQLIAWNRRQDWAILKTDAQMFPTLRHGDAKSWNIGDHCYWLDAKAEGARVIAEGEIVGKEQPEGWGERISISGLYNLPAVGGPLMNDRGEVLGVLGGAVPGTMSGPPVQDMLGDPAGGAPFTVSGTVVPLSLILSNATTAQTTLQALWDAGKLIPPVTASRYVMFGMITQGGPEKKKKPVIREMKFNFTREDQWMNVNVAFQAKNPVKTTVEVRLHDVENRLTGNGDQMKLNLRTGENSERNWYFPLAKMTPGTYRVDVLVGEEVAWRQFFRLRE